MILKGRDDSLKFPRDGYNFYRIYEISEQGVFQKGIICGITKSCIPENSLYRERRKASFASKLDESEVGHKFGSFCTLGKLLRENSE